MLPARYATQQPGREPSFHLWDTRTNGPSAPTDGQLPFNVTDVRTGGGIVSAVPLSSLSRLPAC
jgi:hypothetical protein